MTFPLRQGDRRVGKAGKQGESGNKYHATSTHKIRPAEQWCSIKIGTRVMRAAKIYVWYKLALADMLGMQRTYKGHQKGTNWFNYRQPNYPINIYDRT